MENLNPRTVNELFVQKLDNEQEKTALEASTSAFVRTKLREVGFARKIINPQYVTKADLQRSLLHDQLVKLVDIEPDSKAMQITLRGQPDVHYIEGQRFEISFFNVSSEEFQKVEEELLAYEMPITEVIERNSVKDIQKIEDTSFMAAVEASITASGKSVSYTPAVSGTIEMGALVQLFNKLEESNVASNANQLKTDLLLMNQADWNKLLLLPATTIGSNPASEQYINGFKYETLLGKKLVVTNKGDLVPEKTIYAFASQEFMGKFYVLQDTKFWVEKKRNLIKWSCYEIIGMGIGNIKSMAKVTLTV
jgi:hypothetical protein